MTQGKSKPKSEAPQTAGKLLKAAREGRELSLKQIEQSTKVRGKYLVALEADDYTNLPHNVYTRGFVHSYARFLDLDAEAVAQQFISERGVVQEDPIAGRGLRVPRIVLGPRALTAAGSVIVGLAAAGYLIWQFSALTAPPKLTIANPDHDQVLYGSLITLSGHVAGGADVYVNDSPILVDGNGNYTDSIALQDGVNSISVSAKNRLGKTSTVTRNILAHVPKTDPAAGLPQAPFDGVAVSVQVQSSSATVTVLIDGKERFKGTMLPGTVQTFKGGQSVEVSTTNGSATSLTVTNATAAGTSLGALGRDSKSKNGFSFDKDTQFQ